MSEYRVTPLGRGIVYGCLFSAALWSVIGLFVLATVWFL